MNTELLMARLEAKHPAEREYLQAVHEVLLSVEDIYNQHPEFEKARIIERLVEPDRIFTFKVPWVDDKGDIQVNTGYRVQFNNAIGPYKGGLRFHASVNLSILKFLGFEQIFKNALTGLPIGGGKGGSDFNPNGKSDMEIMRFCQAFMTELYRHIGPDVDVPAGDIGVAGREIGFMYGQYKRIKGCWENGVLTGKGLEYGGSLFRPEATGYGATYYTNEVLLHEGDTFEGKTVAMSGFGNVAWGVAQKVAQLGGKVVTLSGPDGYCYDPEGITTQEKFDYMVEMRTSGRNRAQDYAEKFGVEFFPGQKPWGVKVDIAMPCAYQNEIGMTEIKQILDENGTKYYIEVANMPTTNEALGYAMAKEGVIVAPSKAVNAGGVAVSALEMAQNSMRYAWEGEEVDAKLVGIMKNIHAISVEAAEGAGMGYNLVAGANIAGFKKVAAAMMAQGLV